MLVTFFSNYMTHHQLPFSAEMVKLLGEGYKFIACEPIADERVNMGFEDMNKKYDFIIRPYEDEKQKELAYRLAVESDVMIFGSGDEKFFRERMRMDKLTFRYAERVLKRGTFIRFIPIKYIRMYNMFLKWKKALYVLCASAYTSHDLSLCGFPPNRCFKWGYFTEIKRQNVDDKIRNKTSNSILWVGRFLGLKHPEAAVLVAEKLKMEGTEFHLTMIGDGEKRGYIEKLIEKKQLENYITLTGSMPSAKVREYMERSEIFLFTSDFHEGWGAVLNEAMNSVCTCVASHAIGSVPFLIDNNKNGLIYKNGDDDELYRKVCYLIKNRDKRITMAKKAYETITDLWSPEIAAEHFMILVDSIINKNKNKIELGCCSRAEIMPNNWYDKRV